MHCMNDDVFVWYNQRFEEVHGVSDITSVEEQLSQLATFIACSRNCFHGFFFSPHQAMGISASLVKADERTCRNGFPLYGCRRFRRSSQCSVTGYLGGLELVHRAVVLITRMRVGLTSVPYTNRQRS